LEAIKQKLTEVGLDAEVNGREKHLYSIYTKMVEQAFYHFRKVLDIYGFPRSGQRYSFVLCRIRHAA